MEDDYRWQLGILSKRGGPFGSLARGRTRFPQEIPTGPCPSRSGGGRNNRSMVPTFGKIIMTVIQVAIPVLRGKRRFHVEKGKRWSVVEHLMLDAVAKRPASAAELAQRSDLPRRVVVEA